MPLALCIAPAIVECSMELVLKGNRWKTCLLHLDDIVIMGKNCDDHLQNLEEIFKRLNMAGLKLKTCELFKHGVKYLGNKITLEEVRRYEDFFL